MAVTRTLATGPDQFFQQVELITKSHSLRGSESLCKLLQYLAKQSLEHPDATLKEYQIATEVYGRHADFDPSADSTIRVQVGRLRLKLADYYATEGANDPIVVKMPKGSYHLVFEARQPGPQPLPVRESPAPGVPAQASTTWRFVAVVLLVCLLVSFGVTGNLLWNRWRSAAASVDPGRLATGPLAEFWRPFISGADEPWVIFSNAAFVGRPETGMRYYNSGLDPKATVRDHYTGVGEVLAVHELDELFASLGRRLRVKRGSLFSLDDAKNTDLIFVGSPSENLSLLDIPGTQEFVFQRMASGPRQGDLAIVTRHPRAGEATTHLASPSDAPMTEDYGIVSVVPGVDPARFVMILAGTTTFGTQGAVEFVCRQDSVEHLLQQIPEASSGEIKPFEALIRVKVARGVPLETELVAVSIR